MVICCCVCYYGVDGLGWFMRLLLVLVFRIAVLVVGWFM